MGSTTWSLQPVCDAVYTRSWELGPELWAASLVERALSGLQHLPALGGLGADPNAWCLSLEAAAGQVPPILAA